MRTSLAVARQGPSASRASTHPQSSQRPSKRGSARTICSSVACVRSSRSRVGPTRLRTCARTRTTSSGQDGRSVGEAPCASTRRIPESCSWSSMLRSRWSARLPMFRRARTPARPRRCRRAASASASASARPSIAFGSPSSRPSSSRRRRRSGRLSSAAPPRSAPPPIQVPRPNLDRARRRVRGAPPPAHPRPLREMESA